MCSLKLHLLLQWQYYNLFLIHEVFILFHVLFLLKSLLDDSFRSEYRDLWFVRLPTWKNPEPCHTVVTYSTPHTASVQTHLWIACFLTNKEKLWWLMHIHATWSVKTVACYHSVLVLLFTVILEHFLNAPVCALLELAVKTWE